MAEGLGTNPNDVTNFDDSPTGGFTLPEEWMRGGMGFVGDNWRTGGRGNWDWYVK